MKKQVLFVDDEPKVLAGLRRMLRGLRHDWDMEFVEGGRPALDHLVNSPCDVVVTDMRMPGMDGCQLLREVMERYPATVRIILSGQCDRQTVLKAVGPTHQFLTKPCDSDTLKSTVARACRLRDHLPDQRSKELVSQVQSLPSDPSAHNRLVAEIRSSTPSLERATEIIAHDMAMSAKVLQLVNSGFFGTPQRVSDPAHAATLLGLESLRDLVASPNVFFALQGEPAQEHFFDALVDHSLAVANAAEKIARAETDDPTVIKDARLSGLLHDIGALVLSKDSPELYLETLAVAQQKQLLLREAEQQIFHSARDDIGAYLLGLWGLPDPVVKAIAFHMKPCESVEDTFSPLTAIHVANVFVEEANLKTPGRAETVDDNYLSRIGRADRLEHWRELCGACSSRGVSP
ncbi:MAG: HDOD domain-containing protein [Pirellulales bacterium]|nr:HDOD domain-containing protein [Pirellulales bacterium]